ncbi:GerW family sporulation protein [Ornithinibacillus bavariensis]|uniref:GerW family sporulation protein n=1 Tax=Ornithinibacillus bavariensis TaxID=545502 RepID=UPI003D25A2A3
MEEHPIQGLMTTAMENLKDMIEVNTIIGDPIETPDGSVIIPVSKLGFGFAAGGSEFKPSGGKKSNSDKEESGGSEGSGGNSESVLPFGGGSGGGVSITPIAFLIVSPKGIKMVHLDENTHIYEKLIDFAPKAVEKIQQLLQESGMGKQNKQKETTKGQGNSKKGEKSEEKDKQEEDDRGNSENKIKDDKERSNSEESSSIYDI